MYHAPYKKDAYEHRDEGGHRGGAAQRAIREDDREEDIGEPFDCDPGGEGEPNREEG